MKKMNDINVSTLNYKASASEYKAVEKASEAAFNHENIFSRIVSIVLTDDNTIREYNRRYRNVDCSTDVLSFPADGGETLLTPPDGFLGDIMISVPRAGEQGAELGHSKERELIFLTVHGILHLLGYDHTDAKTESIMLKAQRSIMAALTEENKNGRETIKALTESQKTDERKQKA